MSRWWKCHDDILWHQKTRRLPPLHKVVLWAAFNTACRSPVRGVLYISRGVPAEPSDLADEAGVPIEEALAAIGTPDQRGTLTTRGPQAEKGIWLDWTPDGVLHFPEWKERQYEADATNAERQRKHREKQKTDNKLPLVTESNALHNVTVTPPEYRVQSTDSKEVVVAMAPDPAKAECLALVNRHQPSWVMSGERYKEFLDYEDRLPWALMLKSVQTTMAAGKTDLRYCLGICEKWAVAGLKALEDVEIYEKRREAERKPASSRQPRSATPASGYQHYDPDEILNSQ